MILILRGHIRTSFDTKNLYNLIKNIYTLFPDLKLVIHTWTIFSNNVSWRQIKINKQPVNEEIIYNYFDDLQHLIKHIIIDDDTKIQLLGNVLGTINNGIMPIVGWKNYWYGKYRIIEYLYNANIDENEMIVNCRFDVLNNSNNLYETDIIQLIQTNINIKFTKNIFIFGDERHNGIDNIYIGNINTMYTLIKLFYNDVDEILSKNNDTIHQERLVFRLNNVLFEKNKANRDKADKALT